ncbi:hypothetical protein LQ953_14945 [Sphingomonas sp. IC-56]|uniref:hypothetical protein n=1 Tax=Sphingomonas sp. IC-56 TaxID=2898529 RepID=UPI001E3D0DEA|nr:hypothetical protein [Sphingomonas sp. IC-56]MCD2325317.1 hypothetical protein [Sphingomonas sp. IC-56]
MFKQPTTFVIGAGASCELGLPSGNELKEQIASLLRTTDANAYGFESPALLPHLQSAYKLQSLGDVSQVRSLQGAARKIAKGLPLALSIDNFLHAHQGDVHVERLGKTAIAACILRAEKGSKLIHHPPYHWVDDDPRPIAAGLGNPELFDTWYAPFSQLMMSQVHRADLVGAFRDLRFVIFNYDRCVEQFLWLAMQDYFDVSADAAADALSCVQFIHPYGSLGPLPWQAPQSEDVVPFGGSDRLNPFRVGERLRTFTESVESEVSGLVKAAVGEAGTIIILGFGYLDQNLELIRPSYEYRRATRVMSTAYKTSSANREMVEEQMRLLAHHSSRIMVDDGSCREFFDHHNLQLSLR